MPDEGWLTTEQFGAPLAAPPMPDPGPAWPEPDGGASARTRWRRADDFGHDDLGMDLADRGRPRWDRPALAVLLIATAVAYVWDLSATGYANQFYAAAVQAATKSWKAFFFGSLDSSNFITVDKPPAALWVMDVSARIFGFNSWSLLVPNALEGVASVALVYATVRRWAGSAAGLIAGALLAATPVAALMFRYDNPDGLLVLLLVAGAYCLTRAVEKAGTGWILATGAMVGLAFLTKMLQAFTVVPAFGLVYLIAAPTTLRRRIGQLLGGLGALVVAGGWWVAIVALIPAADRPFVDGAPDNSILNLIFVYNGFGRLTGNAQPAGFSGTPGLLRLFNDSMGGQAAWLIPAAVVAAVAGVAARWRRPRTDRVRAAILLWAGWLLVTGAVFSYGKGIIHTYYTVALAPAIAALVGIGVRQLWVARHQLMARLVGAVAVGSTGALAWVLLDRSPSWYPWIRTVVAVTAAAGMILLVAAPLLRRFSNWTWGAAMALIAVGCLSGPLAYAADTVATPHNQSGGTPSAGPTSAFGGFGGFGGVGGRGAPGGRGGPGFGFGGRPGGTGFGGTGGPSGLGGAGGPSGFGNGAGATGAGFGQDGGLGELGGSGFGGGGFGGGGFGGGGFGGFGGATTSKALVRALESDAQDYRWVAATSGSNSAASLELATGGEPVMAIGGFSGQGGHLSLKAFEGYVAKGEIHYYIAGGGGGPGGGSTTAAITAWVESHFKSETIGGQTVYNLTAPTGS